MSTNAASACVRIVLNTLNAAVACGTARRESDLIWKKLPPTIHWIPPLLSDEIRNSCWTLLCRSARPRSEEHTSELQSLMRISYAVFCLKTKTVELDRMTHDTHEHL